MYLISVLHSGRALGVERGLDCICKDLCSSILNLFVLSTPMTCCGCNFGLAHFEFPAQRLVVKQAAVVHWFYELFPVQFDNCMLFMRNSVDMVRY